MTTMPQKKDEGRGEESQPDTSTVEGDSDSEGLCSHRTDTDSMDGLYVSDEDDEHQISSPFISEETESIRAEARRAHKAEMEEVTDEDDM